MSAGTWRGLAAAATVVAVALSIPAVRHLREEPPRLPLRLLLPDIPGAETGGGDDALDAAIAPNEQEIVVVATTQGVPRLWRRTLADDRAVTIDGTDGASLPVWTIAGDAVTFFAGGELRQLRLADGRVTVLADAAAPGGATWLADGSLLFATGDGPIRRWTAGAATGPAATALRPGERRHEFPVATGVDAEFVYVAVGEDGRRLARLVSADGDRQLVQTSGHAQLIGDRLLFVRDNVLLVQRFDRNRHRLAGTASPLVLDVGTGRSGRSFFAASPRLLLSAGSAIPPRDIVWIDAADGRVLQAANAPADYWQVRVSPDDRQLAVTMAAPLLRTLDIYRVPSDGGTPVSLSTSIFADTDPVWSPDGSRMIFRSLHGGRAQLVSRPILPIEAGVDPLPGLEPTAAAGVPTDWSGDVLLLHGTSAGTGADIAQLDVRGRGMTAIANSTFDETDARWSSDQAWLAYVSDERGERDVYVRAWPRARLSTGLAGTNVAEGRRVSFGGGAKPRWGHDGRTLFFQRGEQIMRVVRNADGSFTNAAPVARLPGLRDFDAAHRSPRLVALTATSEAAPHPPRVFADWMR